MSYLPIAYENLGRMQSHMATGDEEAFASQKQGFQGDLPSFVFLCGPFRVRPGIWRLNVLKRVIEGYLTT
jgi:hypothetical protein